MLILLVFSLISKSIFYSLIFCLIVRCFFFLTHLDQFTYHGKDHTVGNNVTMFAFIWTYPMINNIVVSYTASSHWIYDLLAILHG